MFENLHDYSKKVFESATLEDLKAPTKLHIRSLAALVIGDTHVDFNEKIQAPPQEIIEHLNEESKS